MRIEFLQSIANERVSFKAGDVVTTGFLPKGWGPWLTSGVIRIRPEGEEELAVAPPLDECAVPVNPARQRRQRKSKVAE
jgi:hypothetical protein